MRHVLPLALALLMPSLAQAQSAFEEMRGTWRGDGTYVEGLVEVRLRCRFDITGDASAIRMAGRCGSSLGAEDFTMTFERGPDGTAVVRDGAGSRDSAVQSLSGRLGRNGMVVSGAAVGQEITVQLLLNADGTLNFATREVSDGSTNQALVTLTRR